MTDRAHAMTDSDLIDAFETGKLDGSDFPHDHHVRVAWGLARRYGRKEGLRRMVTGIRDMAARAGHPEKYHHTITRAWFELIASTQSLDGDSALFDRTLLGRYYTPERLNEGRERWLTPDLQPLRLPSAGPASPEQLSAVLRRIPTAVGVIAARHVGEIRATTVSSITSVSRTPPLMSVCLSSGSRTLDLIRRAPYFSLSILAAGQSDVAVRFAAPDRDPGAGQFAGVAHQIRRFGPVIDRAAAWIGCQRHAVHACGDHHIVLGAVSEAQAGAGQNALVRCDGEYL